MDPFTNEKRNRYYGLRIGDIINVWSPAGILWGNSKVLDYGGSDNNCVIIENKAGKPIKWVAEHCEIVTKVEDL